jgi:hypothetical protein
MYILVDIRNTETFGSPKGVVLSMGNALPLDYHVDGFRAFRDLSDEDIVEQAQAGRQDATDYMLYKYQKLVYIWTRPYFLQGAEDDDLLQEGMIGLYKAIRDFAPGSSFPHSIPHQRLYLPS